jgi:hypothetical protein
MSLATSFIAFLVAAGRAKPDPSALRISALEVENIRLRSAVSELRARLAAAQAPLEGPRGPSGPAMAAQTSDWPAEQVAQHQRSPWRTRSGGGGISSWAGSARRTWRLMRNTGETALFRGQACGVGAEAWCNFAVVLSKAK